MGIFGKILLVMLVVCVVLVWWKHAAVQKIKRDIVSREAKRRPAQPESGTMVRCATCGLFLPLDEAVTYKNRYYCSTDHADQAQRPAR